MNKETVIIDGIICKIVKTNIRNIKAGDTVLRYGHLCTVCKKDISYDSFMGWSLFGDSYHLGYKPVEKVLIFNGIRFI